ncbi:hypothetical protein [Pseudobutyrivibrio xylanivorans]|uniref:Uncharacterized protein n=1 Tax=Pseudobutyrivibrio xylanivorans TaxID=185007 RepID=A0A5P6VM35_PSEXY|nr:hypothetical protein [Pseudobutyrivibrio xylanivorans]QFJ53393.1 hypothetical protein FXF36_00155 [Pseudobutyrivibrio xylanivorans]QFJ53470.1 hypothetical protein FXF36_00565 [Pseudobutyrivibrio xylanivorans]
MKYAFLSEDGKKELIEIINMLLREYERNEEETEDCCRCYRLPYRNEEFEAFVTEGEKNKVIDLAIALMEELKSLANSTYTKEDLNQLLSQVNGEPSAIKSTLLMESIQTPNIKALVAEAAETVRVGGAYLMFVARPEIAQLLFVTLYGMIDKFDDEIMYDSSTFLITRGILNMHKCPVTEDEMEKEKNA